MNQLEMVQFVQGNIATSFDLPFAGPTTLTGAGSTGQYLEFQKYVQQAYKALQLENPNWRFRTNQGILPLAVGQNFYSLGQIQAAIPDYEDIVHLHFWDDTAYGLVAQHKTGPVNTTTSGAITQSAGSTFVPLTNAANYQPFVLVNVNGGGGSLIGYVQEVNGSVLTFATDKLILATTVTAIAPGSPVLVSGSTVPDIATQTFCFYVQYQNWRGWKDRNVLPLGKPVYYTETPDNGLEFNPVPDSATSPYFFHFDYRVAIDTLDTGVDTETPKYLPARFHEAICWKAIMYWARNRKQADAYASAKIEYDRIYEKLVIDQLPDIEPYLMELYS